VIALGFQGLYSLKAVSQSQRDEVVKALSERFLRLMQACLWLFTGWGNIAGV
jgi:hypothetical protein